MKNKLLKICIHELYDSLFHPWNMYRNVQKDPLTKYIRHSCDKNVEKKHVFSTGLD